MAKNILSSIIKERLLSNHHSLSEQNDIIFRPGKNIFFIVPKNCNNSDIKTFTCSSHIHVHDFHSLSKGLLNIEKTFFRFSFDEFNRFLNLSNELENIDIINFNENLLYQIQDLLKTSRLFDDSFIDSFTLKYSKNDFDLSITTISQYQSIVQKLDILSNFSGYNVISNPAERMILLKRNHSKSLDPEFFILPYVDLLSYNLDKKHETVSNKDIFDFFTKLINLHHQTLFEFKEDYLKLLPENLVYIDETITTFDSITPLSALNSTQKNDYIQILRDMDFSKLLKTLNDSNFDTIRCICNVSLKLLGEEFIDYFTKAVFSSHRKNKHTILRDLTTSLFTLPIPEYLQELFPESTLQQQSSISEFEIAKSNSYLQEYLIHKSFLYNIVESHGFDLEKLEKYIKNTYHELDVECYIKGDYKIINNTKTLINKKFLLSSENPNLISSDNLTFIIKSFSENLTALEAAKEITLNKNKKKAISQ